MSKARELRIHITPEDYIADVDEIADGSEPRARCRYFIEPEGPYGINETGEANYYVGNEVFYHEHTTGYEAFLVDAGSLEIISRSRKSVARKGDIVFHPAFYPHMIHVLEDETIFRAFHQGLNLIPSIIEERRMRDMYPDLFNDMDFRQEVNEIQQKLIGFDYLRPECSEDPENTNPLVRRLDFSLAEYDFDGINLKLKIGRWETAGVKEVWQLTMERGYSFSWEGSNHHPMLYDLFSGSVEVKLDGLDPFTAKARDLLHIPKYMAGRVTTLEDTVLFDFGCQGFLTRLMDELRVHQVREPAKLQDVSFIRSLMKKYNYYVMFERL